MDLDGSSQAGAALERTRVACFGALCCQVLCASGVACETHCDSCVVEKSRCKPRLVSYKWMTLAGQEMLLLGFRALHSKQRNRNNKHWGYLGEVWLCFLLLATGEQQLSHSVIFFWTTASLPTGTLVGVCSSSCVHHVDTWSVLVPYWLFCCSFPPPCVCCLLRAFWHQG